jgi:RimJ/RimL family protein N-acetyltransferase
VENKEIIGWAGIQLMPDSSCYELFYALRADYWGQEFATEAGAALLNSTFNLPDNPPSEVFALVFPKNILSIRVLEKLGMSFLEYYFDEPTERHACLYRVTHEEFTALRQTDYID